LAFGLFGVAKTNGAVVSQAAGEDPAAANVIPFRHELPVDSDGGDGKIVLTTVEFDRVVAAYGNFETEAGSAPYKTHTAFRRDGIHFKKIVFTQEISIASCRYAFGLYFEHCCFQEAFDARSAQMDSLAFKDCSFAKSFKGSALVIAGNVDFSKSRSHTQIDLSVARIRGDLVLADSDLCYSPPAGKEPPDVRRGSALFCGGINVHSVLMDGMRCRGRVFLDAATLTGIIKASNAVIERSQTKYDRTNRWDHIVFSASDTTIKGAVILGEEGRGLSGDEKRQSFCARGQVSLSNSRIGGSLVCTNGKFSSAFHDADTEFYGEFKKASGWRDDVVLASLNASRAKVEGAVLLNSGFESYGEVRFNGVEVRGVFRASDASIYGDLPRKLDNKSKSTGAKLMDKALSLDQTFTHGRVLRCRSRKSPQRRHRRRSRLQRRHVLWLLDQRAI